MCVIDVEPERKKKDEGTAKMGTDFNVVSILKVKSLIQARDKIVFHLSRSYIVLIKRQKWRLSSLLEHKPCSLKHVFL